MKNFFKRIFEKRKVIKFYKNISLKKYLTIEELHDRECKKLVNLIKDKILNKEYSISHLPEFSRDEWIKIKVEEYNLPKGIKLLETKEDSITESREIRSITENYSWKTIANKVSEVIKNEFKFSEVKSYIYAYPSLVSPLTLSPEIKEIFILYFKP